ncbi:helix-turn-helix transcriptional regulator [Clostridium sporogenes]|uniref:Helix-turn-helix transcriptional regulator n=1 Tax=Clostridium sporogenes TaxID=1509 RepID=A0AAE4FQF5_CLOSG|nr:helix-turn-helix transcriptional regulator [Clostridium sporogenes]MDS1005326.1 helix-turn-helix transcriptional regulator [Clostridium sporogenes]
MTLKDLRIESGLKARKVAEYLGISRTQLYNLEKGKYKLDKLKLEKLCKVYCKDIEELLSIASIKGKEVKTNDRKREKI